MYSRDEGDISLSVLLYPVNKYTMHMDIMMLVKLKNSRSTAIYSKDVVWLNLKPKRYTGMILKSHSNRLFLARLRRVCKIQEAVGGRLVQYFGWI